MTENDKHTTSGDDWGFMALSYPHYGKIMGQHENAGSLTLTTHNNNSKSSHITYAIVKPVHMGYGFFTTAMSIHLKMD